MDDGSYQVVLMTSANIEEAEKIAETLVEEKLAACVNLIEPCESIYKWEGRIVRDREIMMIAKTHRSRFENFKQRVTELHSYEVPEIIALCIEAGSPAYINFLKTALGV